MPACIQQQVPLAPRTTLGVGGCAEYFAEITSESELREVVQWARSKNLKITIIGGGSNILVSDAGVQGLVIQLHFCDISYINHDAYVEVTAGAGVVLDALIQKVVAENIWGLENLSSIPGTVGALPIQNVGAYGVEAKDSVIAVSVYDQNTNTIMSLTNDACAFGYRDSIFKHTEGKSYIVLSVTFRLTRTSRPQLAYKDLALFFEGHAQPNIEEIRQAVISIRSKKFPDWRHIGTAGSFFKNPIITKAEYDRLHSEYPELPGYTHDDELVKISLGWILDNVCHLKGYTEDGIGLYAHQALVLVCEKGTRAKEVENFSQKIIDIVFQKTGIIIEREVTLCE